MKIFGFAGWSGSGKTTLIERLIPVLVRDGARVSLVKHAHHEFDIDQPGKDSWRHRQAGCVEVLVSSGVRWALMHELRGTPELTLPQALEALAPCDLVLVEGYKTFPLHKLEVWRPEVGKALLHPDDPNIVGLASDDVGAARAVTALPVFALDDVDAIATFVLANAILWPPKLTNRGGRE
ncbi:MAG: molybdopterin-guanine dinucleotide biosynthesis protein B [Casimicrobiaceae bacterium]